MSPAGENEHENIDEVVCHCRVACDARGVQQQARRACNACRACKARDDAACGTSHANAGPRNNGYAACLDGTGKIAG